MNEVRLRRGEIVREGLHTTLADMRKMGREGWRAVCPETSIFILGRERAKLGYFWKHAYLKARSGKHLGLVVNPDTHKPISTDDEFLDVRDFDKKRLHEIGGEREERNDSSLSALAGRPQQDPAHGAGRLHGPLHARVVRLCHRRRGPPTGRGYRARQRARGSGQSRKDELPDSPALCSAAMPTISTTPCSGSMPVAWCGTASPGDRLARNASPSSLA